MSPGNFDREIEAARQRLETLTERARGSADQRALMLETLEDLSTALEELHVAGDELRHQNEELAAARQIVEAQRQRYQELFEFAPDAYLVTDPEGTIQEANSAAAILLGVDPKFLIGKPLAVFLSGGDQTTFYERVTRLQEATQSVEDWQLSVQPRERASFPASVTVGVVRDTARRLIGLRWLIRDITERRRAEEQLRNSQEQLRGLAAHLETVREEERTTGAREIHDDLGQGMAGLKLNLAWLAGQLPENQLVLREKADEMVRSIDAMLGTVLRISEGMHSSLLDLLGLVAAIQSEVRTFQVRTGIGCQVIVGLGDLRLDRQQATALFRICQEGLTNVADHAQATHVTIRLQQEAGQLILAVEDDGRGINDQEITSDASFGLVRMREQALSLGGDLIVVGRPGAGTAVTVKLPLQGSSEGANA